MFLIFKSINVLNSSRAINIFLKKYLTLKLNDIIFLFEAKLELKTFW